MLLIDSPFNVKVIQARTTPNDPVTEITQFYYPSLV